MLALQPSAWFALQMRIHPMSLLKDSEGPQASCSTTIHLAHSSEQIRKLANPWKESICSTIYYRFTLWETFQIHSWHSGKAKPPGLMFSPAAHPRQRLKSQTDVAELGSWHPKFLEAANSERKKGHCLTLKNNDSTLWPHLKLISTTAFLKLRKYRNLSDNITNDSTR